MSFVILLVPRLYHLGTESWFEIHPTCTCTKMGASTVKQLLSTHRECQKHFLLNIHELGRLLALSDAQQAHKVTPLNHTDGHATVHILHKDYTNNGASIITVAETRAPDS